MRGVAIQPKLVAYLASVAQRHPLPISLHRAAIADEIRETEDRVRIGMYNLMKSATYADGLLLEPIQQGVSWRFSGYAKPETAAPVERPTTLKLIGRTVSGSLVVEFDGKLYLGKEIDG